MALSYDSYWHSQKDAYIDALKYVKARKEGTITSYRTPWSKMNDAGVDGIEWNSLLVIGGRPGSGKTLIKDQIVRESSKNNKGTVMRILEFQMEMVARTSKTREFSSVLGKTYKEICSAGGTKLAEEDYQKLLTHSKQAVGIDKHPVDLIEKSVTVENFKKIVEAYMDKHSIRDADGELHYTKTVITADHSILFQTGNGERSKTDMLYNLGEACTYLKRKFPIIIIMLSQLGRGVESPERNEDGKYGNYILDTDIFGGDALLQHADMVVASNIPAKKFINYYGPQRYIIDDDKVLVWHFLKCRSGDTRMSFMKAAFERMEVHEMTTPGMQTKINTR
jgi:replicative DNA helicase